MSTALDQTKKIRELLEGFETAMLVTQGEDSPFHARPMAIARVESNCGLWFFTGRTSAKVSEVRNDERVLVVCQDEMRCYVALRGTAQLIVDPKKAAELWKESYRTWFPKGTDDPDLLLLRVEAEDAEYWDNEGFKSIQYLFEAAKAYARGIRPHMEESEQHGKVSFTE
jgi:general stress protein 26